jgi:hypothetical protein
MPKMKKQESPTSSTSRVESSRPHWRKGKRNYEKRVTGVTDHSLERKLAAIAIQEQCLEEWTYKDYSYNALAKHMLLNE